MSEEELQIYKQGRTGKNELSIVSVPRDIADASALEKCGKKHQFLGRTAPDLQNCRTTFPTFTFDRLQFNERKWYYCVRFLFDTCIQIGWATDRFYPDSKHGVGDDKYSWSYDGSRGVFFHGDGAGYYGQYNDIRWKANDICGCGIEIDGRNTNIKYWLNGKFLGTAFAHQSDIPLTDIECNLLPHGQTTTFYPCITVQIQKTDTPQYCELIVSPEDMEDCPLPNGYKPLLLPKLIRTENSIVDYPFNAYVVGENPQDFHYVTRTELARVFVRDVINEDHLEFDNHQVEDTNKCINFRLSIDRDDTSVSTISFNFRILVPDEKATDITLFTLNSTEIFAVPMSVIKLNEENRCAIIFDWKTTQIKMYINTKSRTWNSTSLSETIDSASMALLPTQLTTAARCGAIARWKYALSEEQLRRLFTYGLMYVASDYQRWKEYRRGVNTIAFEKNQKRFLDGKLLPFDGPFDEEVWERKKKQADDQEEKYFLTNEGDDYSVVQLFGNKTYLVLEKSKENWSNYTLILDLFIPRGPKTNEKLTIITFNSQSELTVSSEAKLCLGSHQSQSSVILDEYFRLKISIRERSVQIFVNGFLQMDLQVKENQCQIEANRIDFFKQTKNTTEETTLRLALKSLTYLNRSLAIDEQLQSLEELNKPPFSVVGLSLNAMGYRKQWIESVDKQKKMSDLHRISRERTPQFKKTDLNEEQDRCAKIVSLNIDTNQPIEDVAQNIFDHFHHTKAYDGAHSLQLIDTENLDEWLRDPSSSIADQNDIDELLDLSELDNVTNSNVNECIESSSHQHLSDKDFSQIRCACERQLTEMYARSTIVNIFDVYFYHQSSGVPLEKFGDYVVLVQLFKRLDSSITDTKIDRMCLLIKSILGNEIQELRKENSMNDDLFLSKAPLLHHFQKDMIIQAIEYQLKPSLFNTANSTGQFNLNFTCHMLHIAIDLVKGEQVDSMISYLFPPTLVNLLFDLFLLIPSQPTKILILCLFTRLTEISTNFDLHDQMKHCLLDLQMKLASKAIPRASHSTRLFLFALTDLIYVLFDSGKLSDPASVSKVSEFRNDVYLLLEIVSLITAWTNANRQISLTKVMFNRTDISIDRSNFSDDDLKDSVDWFHSDADQELLRLMNERRIDSNSIANLPTGSDSNSTFYQNYPALSNIPAKTIQIRAYFLDRLSTWLQLDVAVFHLALETGQGVITDRIRTMKRYILYSIKCEFLGDSINRTALECTTVWQTVNFDTVKASTQSENSANSMFYQAYQQLHHIAHILFRRRNAQLWHAQYLGMNSTDAGGPYRDSITCICSDLCSSRLSLFILCPNGRTNSGLNRDCWIPNVYPPNKAISSELKKQYRFVGQLIGMGIRKKHYLNLKFPPFFWKQLVRDGVTIEDIQAIDVQSFTILHDIEKAIEQFQSMDTDHDITSAFTSLMSELRFDAVSSAGQTYELVPHGSDIPVTSENFKEYSSAYRQCRLKEFDRQMDFIRQGLHSVVSSCYLNRMTDKELETLVCGAGQIDIELLKRNTVYNAEYNQDTPCIQRFWTVLTEMFNDEQRKLFLIFVWGRSTLPMRDEEFYSKFTISPFYITEGEVDKTLPRSYTCFFAIDLPEYSTIEIMYDRLNYAIIYCSSIDADGIANETTNVEVALNT